jgi:hypothetical protein
MSQVLLFTNREVGLLQAEWWLVLPIEVNLGDFMFDWQVERQCVVVDDAVTAVVEITWHTCNEKIK